MPEGRAAANPAKRLPRHPNGKAAKGFHAGQEGQAQVSRRKRKAVGVSLDSATFRKSKDPNERAWTVYSWIIEHLADRGLEDAILFVTKESCQVFVTTVLMWYARQDLNLRPQD